MRSGAWRPAPHTWHQVWISASLSACLADSMRLVFASCQPAAADSALAVRPASSRISRRRSASSCLARWTLDDGEMATAMVLWDGRGRSGGPVFGVRDRAFPDGLERDGAQPHDGGSASCARLRHVWTISLFLREVKGRFRKPVIGRWNEAARLPCAYQRAMPRQSVNRRGIGLIRPRRDPGRSRSSRRRGPTILGIPRGRSRPPAFQRRPCYRRPPDCQGAQDREHRVGKLAQVPTAPSWGQHERFL